ncbi:MAG: hypothetical protein AB7H97_04065 [Pseudobdellovibrionaceae bacterium]
MKNQIYKESIKKWAVRSGRSRQGVLRGLLNVEGKKKQIKAGDMNEALKILVDLQVQAKSEGEGGPLDVLYTISKDKLARELARMAKKKG